jgi:hypothetical protein
MEFTSILKKAFPYISAAAQLGGPLGTMAAAAVGKALGMDKPPEATEDAISSTISNAFATPEQRIALLKMEQDFQLQMQQLGFQHEDLQAALEEKDRESARAREVAVRDYTPMILSYLTVAFSFTIFIWYFERGTSNNTTPELIGMILAAAISALTQVLSYYLGSSSGSTAKTAALVSAATRK